MYHLPGQVSVGEAGCITGPGQFSVGEARCNICLTRLVWRRQGVSQGPSQVSGGEAGCITCPGQITVCEAEMNACFGQDNVVEAGLINFP